jgi:hypothetical protein
MLVEYRSTLREADSNENDKGATRASHGATREGAMHASHG